MGILELMKERRIYFDGGMGSLLQARGLKPGELPETWNLSRPEIITEIHREYLDAGSDVVTTNTFGANHFKFKEEDGYSRTRCLNSAARSASRIHSSKSRSVSGSGSCFPSPRYRSASFLSVCITPLLPFSFPEFPAVAFSTFRSILHAGFWIFSLSERVSSLL